MKTFIYSGFKKITRDLEEMYVVVSACKLLIWNMSFCHLWRLIRWGNITVLFKRHNAGSK